MSQRTIPRKDMHHVTQYITNLNEIQPKNIGIL